MLIMAFGISYLAQSQETCGQVGLIGEFNGWSDDLMMARDPENPAIFEVILSLNAASNTDTNAVVEVKFRANHDWAVNWGSGDFPTGIAVQDGDNIPVPVDTATTTTTDYHVTFNCETGEYSFVSICGNIGVIGEFNSWSDDWWMDRDMDNMNMWSTIISFSASQDADTNGFIEAKFRQSADWAVNWGGDAFPSDTGYQDGPNIMVPLDSAGTTTDYKVSFDCETGIYNFVHTGGTVAIIGEFNGWSGDYTMHRMDNNPDQWYTLLTLTPDMDGDTNGVIELKFRENADWGVNWGGDGFPTGVGTQDGSNILAPLDESGLTTDYYVMFDAVTGDYSFEATCGAISMIGQFIDWNGDIPMNRSMDDPNMFTLTRSWFEDSEVKFRENADWTNNWGAASFHSGTGEPNGANIPLTAGVYDVTFDCSTLDYNFTENTTACGEIGMVGDFNEWGGSNPSAPTDVYLVRDPMYPTLFSATYNFTSSTGLLFRVDGQTILNENVWGGVFPGGQGVHDVTQVINVPGGIYNITFNCIAGDFYFERLGNSVTAPEVFALNVDGSLNESDWDLSQNVAQIVEGSTDTPADVFFGVAYNSDYFYFGVDVTDESVVDGDIVHVFIDGDKTGGEYGDADAHLSINAAGTFTVVHGPAASMGAVAMTSGGYSAEFAIPWADLGITPETGGQVAVDVIVGDDDATKDPAYYLAWNGDMNDTVSTSGFGDCNLGTLSCGSIGIYNATIGDVILRNPTDMPTTYVGNYEFFDNQNVVFRKDKDATVFWGSTDFPSGTATVGGDEMTATAGRYRVSFDCLSGDYTFTVEGTDHVAYAEHTDTPTVVDGDLSEYNLQYTSDILAAGTGPINNTVTWGAVWNTESLYLGVKVVDAVVEGSGNPWDNDAIEFYFDGNHDRDGTYDADFDTQLIMDFVGGDSLWVKADGVPITDETSVWNATADGYTVELRLAWSNFDFDAGQGRSVGFSLGNNDSDNGIGRDYQSVWYGTGNNWSNTADLGDLQLSGGPYYSVSEIFRNNEMILYPNPSSGIVNLKAVSDAFNGKVTFYVSDITGRTVLVENANFSTNNNSIILRTNNFESGIYFVTAVSENGSKAVKKLIVR